MMQKILLELDWSSCSGVVALSLRRSSLLYLHSEQPAPWEHPFKMLEAKVLTKAITGVRMMGSDHR
jgi:hypothetical protein